MPKIDIIRTELVWPGKYDEAGALRFGARAPDDDAVDRCDSSHTMSDRIG